MDKRQSVSNILLDFEWINIPSGKVSLEVTSYGETDSYLSEGQKHSFDVPAFAIAKYPITNKQYAEYVNETGKTPDYWDNDDFNRPMQPVVGVSWHDAIAFCEWLSEESGDKIFLPTEQQWQRAAQGDDERTYPWGNQWDVSRCNNKDNGIGKTTSVTVYEDKGDSPYGVVDMSGNVWEWCLTAWETGANMVNDRNIDRVLRGGSFDSSKYFDLRSVDRAGDDPDFNELDYGFRCVVSVPVQ